MNILNLPNEILTIILIYLEHIPSILRFGQASKVIQSILSSPSSDARIYQRALYLLNSSVDLRICKTVSNYDTTDEPLEPSWKRACQIYCRILHNLDHGLDHVVCTGSMFDPVRSIRNQIPPSFGVPVESFNNFMTDANIDNGLVYSMSNWRDDPDNVVSSASICFDFVNRKYRVIPVPSETESIEYPMYNDPELPYDMRWDFSSMTQRRCLKRVGNVIIMAGLSQPQNQFNIVARNHDEELWRIPSPVTNLNILATAKYLITASEFPQYLIYDIRTGHVIASGKAPFSDTESISCATETHFVVFEKSSLYCISWDKLIQLSADSSTHDISEWTAFGNIDDGKPTSIFHDVSFLGHSFGYRYIALELYTSENTRAFIIDLYGGTLSDFMLPSTTMSLSSPPRETQHEQANSYNWTSPMERSLMNEYGPRLLQTAIVDPRHAMFFWAVDQKGTVVFLSSLILTQLGRVYCDRGGKKDIRFADYL